MNYTNSGEWKILKTEQKFIGHIIGIGLDDTHAIATVNVKQFPLEAEGNSHLITAAPEMYEALQKAKHTIEVLTMVTGYTGESQYHTLEIIGNALAKAEGKHGRNMSAEI